MHQNRLELRIGCPDATDIFDDGGTRGKQTRDRDGHGNPVITKARQGSPTEFAAAIDCHAIVSLLNFHTHRPQIFGDGGDTVRLLKPELLSASNDCPPLRQRGGDSQDR